MRSVAAAVCLLFFCALGVEPATAADWELRQLSIGEPAHSSLQGVSCPSAALCVAVGESGTVASSANPTGGAGAWQVVRPTDPAVEADSCSRPPPWEPEADPLCPEGYPRYRSVRAISCPSPSLCVAVTFDGYAYSSTDPTGPAASWHVADLDGSERDTHLESVSCPDPGFCVAVSGDRNTPGKVLSTTDPIGPGTAWDVTQLDETLDLRGVDCLSRTFCLAVAAKGRILASTNPGGGPSVWDEIGTPGGVGDLEGVSCVDGDSFLCVSGNAGGNLLSTRAPTVSASSWSEVNGGGSVQIMGVSCPTPSGCTAVDNNGDVLVSSEPAGAAGSWSISNLVPYSPPQDRLPPLNALFSASCPTVKLCVLVGASGRIFTNDDPFAAVPSPVSSGKSSGKRRRLIKRPRTRVVEADRFHNKIRGRRFKARFRFYARSKVRGFVCKRDRGPYRRCRSPLTYWVPVGEHVLHVRAIGPTGLRGPVATLRFSVVRSA